jgi:hypothetical protein
VLTPAMRISWRTASTAARRSSSVGVLAIVCQLRLIGSTSLCLFALQPKSERLLYDRVTISAFDPHPTFGSSGGRRT